MKQPVLLLLPILLLVSSVCLIAQVPESLQEGLDSIQPMDVYHLCKQIASEEYQGRLTGHEGYTAAAEWAAGKFREWKLKPVSRKEGYLQAFPCPYTLVDDAEMTLFLTDDGEERADTMHLVLGTDFMPMSYSDSGARQAGLVFAGWGISAPELGYDDYDGIDVKDKFVLTFRGTPDRERSEFTEHDHHRKRMQTARDNGALGLFYIYEIPYVNPNGDLINGFTPAEISESIADQILKEKGLTSAELKRRLRESKEPDSFELESTIHYRVESRHFPDGTGYNIAGYAEGSDPELKKECLIIGGHFDHCGFVKDMVFPGANDNASGSAVVMAIAQAFATFEPKPKRSVLFVVFGGEEMGGLGSAYIADHFPAQFSRMDGMMNFDMVGEGDGARVGYSPNAADIKAMLDESDQTIGILKGSREIRQIGVRSGDFGSFFIKGAPCLSFCSNGPHLYYHQTGDTIYRINPDVMADIARAAFLTGYWWANR